MKKFRDYRNYVADKKWAASYSEYQKKYAVEPRESDKKSARLVLSALQAMPPLRRPARILDIGCSTGNFLKHLKQIVPDAELTGGDLMAPAIEECKNNRNLSGISFELMDVFAIPTSKPFDVIVANAVNVYFEPDEYERAVKSISSALGVGGTYIAYEWVFPGSTERRIVEKSGSHPEGLKFWFRSEAAVLKALHSAGFDQAEVQPFDIPIDLPPPPMDGTGADFNTYTKIDPVTGRRLMYRGDLFQPWAHITARRN